MTCSFLVDLLRSGTVSTEATSSAAMTEAVLDGLVARDAAELAQLSAKTSASGQVAWP